MEKTEKKPRRIAVFMTWPQPFHLPIFRELHKNHKMKIDFYCLEHDFTRGWGDIQHLYPVKSISGFIRFGRFRINLPPIRLFLSLILHRYDCLIIGGWERIYHQLLHVLCYCWGIPVIVGSDLRFGPGGRAQRKRPKIKAYIRIRFLKWVLKRAKGALGSGLYAVEWFREMGFDGFLSSGFFGVDTNRFTPKDKQLYENEFNLLYIGRLAKRKRVTDIIKALSYLNKKRIPIRLTIAGDGPCLHEIMELAKNENVQECIIFQRTVPHLEVSKLMRNTDVFIFPSEREPWGATLIEAASAGLALLVSDEIGAAKDVVCNGKNGFVFPTGDALSLSIGLERLWHWKNDGRMPEIEKISRSLGEKFSFENCASIYKKGIMFALNNSHQEKNIQNRLTPHDK